MTKQTHALILIAAILFNVNYSDLRKKERKLIIYNILKAQNKKKMEREVTSNLNLFTLLEEKKLLVA